MLQTYNPKNKDLIVYINGELVHRDQAGVSPFDSSVQETNATHIFLVKNGVIHTSTTKACPTGITRDTIIKICKTENIPLEIRDIPETEIHQADEVFCTGTMGEIVAINRIDDTVYNENLPGEMTQRLASIYQKMTQSEGYSFA
jgi:branched-chain amino acid aminotransferase